jgi:hypothetical protein
LRADYRLDELSGTTTPSVGTPVATATGALVIGERIDGPATCSDDSAITGIGHVAFDPHSPTGAGSAMATITCAGSGTLPASVLRTALSFDVSTTSDGGDATAVAKSQLLAVEATIG